MIEPPVYTVIFSEKSGNRAEDGDVGWLIARSYPDVKNRLDERQREELRKIAVRAILRRALRSLGPTKRSAKLRRDSYRFGADEIDLEATCERIIGKPDYRAEDIVVETREQKKLACALMVDTSLSMAGEKLAVAAVGASMLAIELREDSYAVVTFNSQARVVKAMGQRKDVRQVISDLLETNAFGYTDMEEGLRAGLSQLERATSGERLGIIITDGKCSEGFHPEKVALGFPKLCVIMVESPHSDAGTCSLLAELGRGRVYRVKDYLQIPGAIRKLLSDFA
ncbi:MAG: vWA domain-containing protein [Candidatus Hadarchaeum sp.]|uniref:vWA domain-containing protein n=1 Tax=Candidatus Hadarchaeum sp. TaxID=2883567 RepID=UPI003D0B0C90